MRVILGNIITKESTFTQDFKIIPFPENLRGCHWAINNRSVIWMMNMESLEDIYRTCEHEAIHGALVDIEEDEDIDESQEHQAIRQMMWADHSL